MKNLSAADRSILAAYMLGILCSAAVTIGGIATFPSPLAGLLGRLENVTTLGIIPLLIVHILRYAYLNRDLPWSRAYAIGFRYCPRWMSASAYLLLISGLAAFATPILLQVPRPPDGSLPSVVSGGLGLAIYSTFFASLYSAIQRTSSLPELQKRR